MFEIALMKKKVVVGMAKSKKKRINKKAKKVIKNKVTAKKTTAKKVKKVDTKVTTIKNIQPEEDLIVKIKSSEKNIIRLHPALEEFKIKTSDKDIITKLEKSQPSPKLRLKIIPRKKSETVDKKIEEVLLKNNNKNTSISIEHPKMKSHINIFQEEDVIKNKEWAIIAYVFAPLIYLFRIDSKYVLYHARRGMNLFIIEVISMILYTISKELIKINVSCANYATFSFTEGCRANPWWLTFFWGVISLAILLVVTRCIAGVLKEKVTPEENMNFNN